jgi:glutaredoxin-related protein
VKQAETALKAYLKVRDAQPEYEEVLHCCVLPFLTSV